MHKASGEKDLYGVLHMYTWLFNQYCITLILFSQDRLFKATILDKVKN